MKPVKSALALLMTTVIMMGAVQAQSAAASGPMSREEVKSERNAAAMSGDIPKGEAGATKARPMGGPPVKRGTQGGETRPDVKADARSAIRSGTIPEGEAGVSKEHPKGGAAGVSSMSTATRADVKADARAANKAREIPKGEAGITANAPKGGEPMTK